MEKLYEFCVKPQNEKIEYAKFKIFKILKVVTIVLAILSAWFAFLWVNALWFLAGLLVLTAIVFAYFQTLYFNYFDLSFYGGELKVVKVKNGIKRRLIVKTSTKNIVKIGKINGETYNKFVKDKSVKKLVATNKIEVDDVVILIDNDDISLMLITKFNEEFTAQLIKSLGVRKVDGDYVKYLRDK